MKRLLLAAAFGLLTSPAFAQDTNALATQYVNLPQVQNMMSEMFSPTTMAKQFAASLPANVSLSEDKKQQIGVVLSEALREMRPRVEELMVDISASSFSAGELRALIDFYSSEHGAAVMEKMPLIMTTVLSRLQPEMQALQLKMGPEILRIVQEPE